MAQIQTGQNLEDHVVEVELETLHPEASASTTSATNERVVDRGHASDEEAVCRICLDDPAEGGETLLLQCTCRGDLALVHRKCAIEWFSRKGNNTCDVCHVQIQNLPMDLLIISETNAIARQPPQGANCFLVRLWQQALGLVCASTFGYFLFLSYFLAKRIGDSTFIVSGLLCFLLGHLSGMVSTTMARGRYVWLYSVVEFSCVVVSTYTLHMMVKLEKQPVLYILLASLVGFVVALCCGFVVVGTLKIRTWWLHQQGANNNTGV